MTVPKKILVLSPHTDDGELGCGASISKWIEQGQEVFYLAFSAAEESVPKGYPKDILRKEVLAATAQLGIRAENSDVLSYPVRRFVEFRQTILDELIRVRTEIHPDLVLLPSKHDIHQDHQVISAEGIRAFKFHSILSYELPWNCIEFTNTCYVPVTVKHMDDKLRALQCYETQQLRSYFRKEFIYSLSTMRGTQINSEFAECFEIIRWIM